MRNSTEKSREHRITNAHFRALATYHNLHLTSCFRYFLVNLVVCFGRQISSVSGYFEIISNGALVWHHVFVWFCTVSFRNALPVPLYTVSAGSTI